MPESRKPVPAGLNPPEQTVGLTGLVPFEILNPPPVTLRPEPGTLRVWIDLPEGWRHFPGTPLVYRIFGGEAGLEFERNGQIVNVDLERLPLELPYAPRRYPTIPPAGQMALDVAFRYLRDDGTPGTQDVQWRQAVVWDGSGANAFDLRFALR